MILFINGGIIRAGYDSHFNIPEFFELEFGGAFITTLLWVSISIAVTLILLFIYFSIPCVACILNSKLHLYNFSEYIHACISVKKISNITSLYRYRL